MDRDRRGSGGVRRAVCPGGDCDGAGDPDGGGAVTGFVLLSARIENHDRELARLREQIGSVQRELAFWLAQLPITAHDREKRQQQLIAEALRRSA
jgi:hypothetical protein